MNGIHKYKNKNTKVRIQNHELPSMSQPTSPTDIESNKINGYVYRYKTPEDKFNVLGDNVTLCIGDESDVATLSDGKETTAKNLILINLNLLM